MKQLAPALTVVVAAMLVLGAGCAGEGCSFGATCQTSPRFDLVVRESANGGTGVVESTGAVAFALDARRDRLAVAEPTLGKVERVAATDGSDVHWRVTGARGAEIDIARRSRPAVRGTVQATASDRGALIQVRLQD